MQKTWEVKLPWPPKKLSPNARVHWASKAKAAKSYRHECWALCKLAGIPKMPDAALNVWFDFFPPDLRKRDDDNIIASFKSGRDGLADAIGVDDNRFIAHHFVSIPILAEKKGFVEVTIRV